MFSAAMLACSKQQLSSMETVTFLLYPLGKLIFAVTLPIISPIIISFLSTSLLLEKHINVTLWQSLYAHLMVSLIVIANLRLSKKWQQQTAMRKILALPLLGLYGR
jgi:hypothetical protein